MSTEANEPEAKVRRGQNSRRKILDAARQLFVERGYHDTRPQDISKAAGVGHGTFYLHFSDKRECFLAFVDEAQSGLDAEVKKYSAQARGYEGRIRGVLMGVMAYSETNPGVITAATADPGVIGSAEEPRKPLIERWAEDWKKGFDADIEAGRICGNYDTDVIAHAVVGLITSACVFAMKNDSEREAIIDNLTRFIVRALRA